MSLCLRFFVRNFASIRLITTIGARTPPRRSTSLLDISTKPMRLSLSSSSSSAPPPKNPSFYAVLEERRQQAFDLYTLNEQKFAATAKDMDDKLWATGYMVAFARPEGWRPIIPRTYFVASFKANLWMKDNVQKATAHDFIDYVLLQGNYLKFGPRGSELSPDVGRLISAWINDHLQPTLDRDAFFEVVKCLTSLPPIYQPILTKDAAENIVKCCLYHVNRSDIKWLLSFMRSMIALQFPLEKVDPTAAGTIWAALNEMKPRNLNDLCRSLLPVITPMFGSELGRIGSKKVDFPIRPPLEKSAWLVQLMKLPFNDEQYRVGRPLAMKAIVLSIANHLQYINLSATELQRFLREAKASYVEEPRLVFIAKTNALPPTGMFGELLSMYPILADSKRTPFAVLRKEVESTNSSDHLLDEDFWRRFWQMMDGACQKMPLSEISNLLQDMRIKARTDLRLINRHMPAPFPARTHRWIDVCLRRLKELAHADDLIRLMICACPENAPKGTLIRLCAAYDALDPRSHSRSGLGRIAAEKMNNLHVLARRPDESDTPAEFHVKSLETAINAFSNATGSRNVDLIALYQSVQSLSASSDHLAVVRRFMGAFFFRHPEQIARASIPLKWLKVCQQLKMRPSPLWWANWCQSLLLPAANLPEDFSLPILTDYFHLEMKYPDYPLPSIIFDNLAMTISNLTHQGKVVDGIHKLSRLRVRDTEIAALTEQRLATLIKKQGQTMDVARAKIISFLHDLTSLNIRPLSNWWSKLNDMAKEAYTTFSPVFFYLLLNAAIQQEVLFDRGSVPPSLIEWALKSLIFCHCSFNDIENGCQLRRLRVVFGDRPFIGAHSDFLAFLSRTEAPRLRSDTRKQKIYVKEAAMWCSSVNFDKRECTLHFPFNLQYYRRDGTVDSLVLNADFAVSIKLLTSVGYQVRVADRSGKTMSIHSNTVES